jgi:hypothetical protein
MILSSLLKAKSISAKILWASNDEADLYISPVDASAILKPDF